MIQVALDHVAVWLQTIIMLQGGSEPCYMVASDHHYVAGWL